MKTNRVENASNGSFEKAKEMERGSQRLVAGTPGRVRGNSTNQCPTTPRPVRRRRPAAASETVTRVAAKVDVGFGNTLFIRGEGEGLSWDKGQPLSCVEGSTWIWLGQRAKDEVTFKLLVNDQLWCRGENIKVGPGRQVEVAPAF
jgi:hypothetical protein